jgi:hypothetical protein
MKKSIQTRRMKSIGSLKTLKRGTMILRTRLRGRDWMKILIYLPYLAALQSRDSMATRLRDKRDKPKIWYNFLTGDQGRIKN